MTGTKGWTPSPKRAEPAAEATQPLPTPRAPDLSGRPPITLLEVRVPDQAMVDAIQASLPIGPAVEGSHNLAAVRLIIDDTVPRGHIRMRFTDGTERTVNVGGKPEGTR